MRAIDITVFLIAIQASLGFVNAIGIFDTSYYATPENHWTEQQVSNLSEYSVNASSTGGDIGLWDQAGIAVEFVWDGLFFMIEILLAVIVIFPTLVSTFHIPAEISVFLQTMIWFMYFLGYRQWKTNKPINQFT